MRGKLAALTAALVVLSPSVSAQQRAGDAALGALSGVAKLLRARGLGALRFHSML
jgi:hypothetical protein